MTWKTDLKWKPQKVTAGLDTNRKAYIADSG